MSAAIASLAVVVLWRARPATMRDATPAHLPAAVAVVIAALLLVSAGAMHSEHLFTDRDPGAYVNTARSVAGTHELFPSMADGEHARELFDGEYFSDRAAGFGFSQGRLVPNFYHLLPALMAMGWSVGGDTGLLLVPALLGALGLLVVYALASTVVGPGFALLAPALLALAPLQPWFARDAYSELPAQVFALAGLWLLVRANESRSIIAGAVAGAVFGVAGFARIDAPVLATGIPLLIVLQHVRAVRVRDAGDARVFWAFGAGLAVTLVSADRLSEQLSAAYRHALSDQLADVRLTVAAGIGLAIALLVVSWLLPAVAAHRENHTWFARGCAGSIALLALWAYVWRPMPRSSLPVVPAGQVADSATRAAIHAWHWSYSMRWFAWYFGAIALIAAVTGTAMLASRAWRGHVAATAILLAVLPTTALYIWRPSAASDHFWIMRRYLPVAVPALAIGFATAAASLSRVRIRASRVPAHLATSVLVAACLASAVGASAPVWRARESNGALAAVHDVCRTVGRDGAVAVVPYKALGLILPQTVRSFCGVPAVRVTSPSTVDWATLAADWTEAGRNLVIVSSGRDSMAAEVPAAREIASFAVDDRYRPEFVRDERPSRYDPRPMEIVLYEVPIAED